MSDNADTPRPADKVDEFIAFLRQRTDDHEEQQIQERKKKEDERMLTRRLPYKDD